MPSANLWWRQILRKTELLLFGHKNLQKPLFFAHFLACLCCVMNEPSVKLLSMIKIKFELICTLFMDFFLWSSKYEYKFNTSQIKAVVKLSFFQLSKDSFLTWRFHTHIVLMWERSELSRTLMSFEDQYVWVGLKQLSPQTAYFTEEAETICPWLNSRDNLYHLSNN